MSVSLFVRCELIFCEWLWVIETLKLMLNIIIQWYEYWLLLLLWYYYYIYRNANKLYCHYCHYYNLYYYYTATTTTIVTTITTTIIIGSVRHTVTHQTIVLMTRPLFLWWAYSGAVRYLMLMSYEVPNYHLYNTDTMYECIIPKSVVKMETNY